MRKKAYYVRMRRIVAVALMVAGFMLPVCAQRGGSRGGFSGHSGSAFHGGFSAPAPHRFSGASSFTGSRSPGMANGFRRGSPGSPIGRSGNPDGNRHRRPYLGAYGAGIPYVVAPWAGWMGPGLYGSADDSGEADSQASTDNGASADAGRGYDAQPPEQDQPAPRRTYQSYSEVPHPPEVAESEDAVTIVFKDGRPPEQIRNYILTGTTLYIQDGHRRNVPVDQLDLVATAKANVDAGVDFQLPNLPK